MKISRHVETVAPDDWKILLSQCRWWINSTIHILGDLMFLDQLCGFCGFSMWFIVMVDLVSTLIEPVTAAYIGYLIVFIMYKHKTVLNHRIGLWVPPAQFRNDSYAESCTASLYDHETYYKPRSQSPVPSQLGVLPPGYQSGCNTPLLVGHMRPMSDKGLLPQSGLSRPTTYVDMPIPLAQEMDLTLLKSHMHPVQYVDRLLTSYHYHLHSCTPQQTSGTPSDVDLEHTVLGTLRTANLNTVTKCEATSLRSTSALTSRTATINAAINYASPERQSRRKAQILNIMAAKMITDIIRTCLGPKAMLKMILDLMGGILLTNDGNVILHEIDVAHPTAKNMIELSRTQDEECGDGTTSVIILAGEILAQSLAQLECDIHPVVIISAYNKVLKEALEIVKCVSIPINTNNDEEILSYQNTDQHQKIPGGSIEESKVLDGIMLNKDITHPNMRRQIKNSWIILLDCPLEYKKGESQTNMEFSKESDWARAQRLRRSRSLHCKWILEFKPDLVTTKKGISDIAQYMFACANGPEAMLKMILD
ncbi:hypothetical protein SCLCIDRAFT_33128 [Scleroderma citrinum Foug A]|uniref:T-complex protein 1 subunit gamma n=1 Tax=Scleroderma citrinum Foug A TaxID=1036808 RepID=A0A0C3D6V6_9AGAM|nr:hypothetical protein SCLCIDRAFT_33128 [Scleroderma citrinum Foug A]